MTVCLGPEITKRKKVQGEYIILVLYKNRKKFFGWGGKKVSNGGHNENNCQ